MGQMIFVCLEMTSKELLHADGSMNYELEHELFLMVGATEEAEITAK